MLVSLTDDDSPIVEFATRGDTKTERILRRVPSGTPDKILRFSTAFWSVENPAGQFLASYGTPPGTAIRDPGTNGSGRLILDTTVGRTELTPTPRIDHAPTFDYVSMKQSFTTNPVIANFRLARVQLSSSLWGRLRGGRPMRFVVADGQTLVFLENTPLARVRLESDAALPIADLRLRVAGGFSATGLRAGTAMVRAVTTAGQTLSYTLVVTSRALNSPPPAVAPGSCPDDVDTWYAGTGFDGDQRLYKQLGDENDWCPAVGCGPTALAMLLGWWDANGVPSAFYKLNSGRGNANNFRFNFESLKEQDAPKKTGENENLMRAVYEDLHELCNTFCVSGQGATAPDQVASAFVEYIMRPAGSWPAPRNEFGSFLVGVQASASWNDAFLLGGTDWEEGGKYVADGIKAGRPGVVGIWTGITPHYALAYGYRRIETFEDCEMVELRRWFKCNMGWGSDSPPEWHDAEAVWFGLTANIWQNNTPTKPGNYIPSFQPDLFSEDLDPSRCAAVIDDAGNRIDLFSVVDRKLPGSFERVHSPDAGNSWFFNIDGNLSSGVFRSSPAATVSTAGMVLLTCSDAAWTKRSGAHARSTAARILAVGRH